MTAQRQASWLTLMALDHIDTAWSDRGVIVETKARGAGKLTDADMRRIDIMAWRYRRTLPKHLAPKLPPRDPIVRDMKAQAAHV